MFEISSRRARRWIGAAFAIATTITFPSTATAQVDAPTPSPLVPIGTGADIFGRAIALNGRAVAIGAPSAGVGGQVAIHDVDSLDDSWTERAIISPSAPVAAARYGWSVAYEGELLVVGAPDDIAGGRVYVYREIGGAFVEQAILSGDPTTNPVTFGVSVATDGTRVVVGDRLANNANGAAAVFEPGMPGPGGQLTFLPPAQLVNPFAQPGAEFGASVAMDRGIIVVGAPRDSLTLGNPLVNAGSVGIFGITLGTWGFRQTLPGNNMFTNRAFGASVDVEGSYIAIGAPGAFANLGGRVFIHELIPGSLNVFDAGVEIFVGQAGWRAGRDVALSGNMLAMGVPGNPQAGVVMARRLSNMNWQILPNTPVPNQPPGAPLTVGEQPIPPVIPGPAPFFGSAIGFDGGYMVVGARGAQGNQGAAFGYRTTRLSIHHLCFGSDSSHLTNPTFQGGAFAFQFGNFQMAMPCPCGNNPAPLSRSGCMNSTGLGAQLQGTGTASVSEGDLHFNVRGLPVGTSPNFGLLTFSPVLLPDPSVGTPGVGVPSSIFDGLRCLGAPLTRSQVRASDLLGTIGINNNGWGGPSGPIGNLTPVVGMSLGFQVTYRELPGFGCLTTLNTTNAVLVTFTP